MKTVDNLGEKHGYGSFADGFEMALVGSSRNNARFIMGGQMSVKIEWLFNGFGFNDLTFKSRVTRRFRKRGFENDIPIFYAYEVI